MATSLKPISEQTMVITGATSGIGLVTTRMAVERGARVVLASRSEGELDELVQEIEASGGEAAYAVADVGRMEDVRKIPETAVDRFGGFDTWFNDAAVSIYGNLTEIDLEDHRRLFDTNYWGIVHGSLVAAEHLQQRGGAIINMGSVLADRSIPKQGPYCASKHAIKGFTEAFRMELEEENRPISVTLIKPNSIDTPYKEHAKNYMSRSATNPPLVYAPQTVARAILHCAEHPERDVIIGGVGRMISTLGTTMPRITDKVMELILPSLQQMDEPAGDIEKNSLYGPFDDGRERGHYPHYVAGTSLYTQARLHPWTTTLATLGAGAVAAAVWRARQS